MNQLVYILIVFINIHFISCTNNSKSEHLTITADQMLEAINESDIQLIDVRTIEEFEEGKIKNAQNICVSNNDFIDKAKKLNKNKPVYVYCKASKRSKKAVEILKDMGFKKIIELQGGIDEWIEVGLDTEKS